MEDYLKKIDLDLSDSVSAAPNLLGYKLVRKSKDGITSGYVVETEAYHSYDPASHSFRGKTQRNSALFESAGTIYVYFTYGMHYCLNIVTGDAGSGQAVLIRALQPVDGMELMKKRRRTDNIKNLTSGPAKLTKAFGIDRDQDGLSILGSEITIERGFQPKEIVITPRIGISLGKDTPWRFFVKDNEFVSKVS